MTPEQNLQDLIDAGFDKSYLTEDDECRVRCSQCEALVIQGWPTHEKRCPNEVREAEEDFDEF